MARTPGLRVGCGQVVNGPEGDVLGLGAVDWRQAEEDVRRLRQRIFTASQAGDLKKVRNLQKLMLRSRANTLVSVRRVTEVNAGRKTAGVDGKVVLAPRGQGRTGRLGAAAAAARGSPSRSSGCISRRRSGKRRPLGIPVIVDRALAGLAVERAGTRVGGPVRAEVLWVSARPWLP